MTLARPDFTEIHEAVVQLDPTLYPSEVHGTMCGLLCAKGLTAAQSWLDSRFQIDPDNLLQREALDKLVALYHATIQQLDDPTFDFHLLLPDDDTEITTRIQGLGDWCQGFLTGLSMSGISNLKNMPQDAIEIATDMAEIARAGSSYDYSGTEEDESAYQELVEYIRVGVLLIKEELHSDGRDENSGPTIH